MKRNDWFILCIAIFIGIAAFIICLLLLDVEFASSADNNQYLQRNPVDKRKVNIYNSDKSDKTENDGYLQRSPIDRRKIILYDKDSNEKGYYQKSPIDRRKTIYKRKD